MWRHGESFGLVWCDATDGSSLLTCGLVRSVRFGLPGLGFMWSGPSVLIDGSWSRPSGGFCLCASVGVRTVLVRSS